MIKIHLIEVSNSSKKETSDYENINGAVKGTNNKPKSDYDIYYKNTNNGDSYN